jgi:hypothetical protein
MNGNIYHTAVLIRIHMHPLWFWSAGYRSGSRWAKITKKKILKKWRNVLFWGLGASPVAYWDVLLVAIFDKKNMNIFVTINFLKFCSSNQRIRIQNTDVQMYRVYVQNIHEKSRVIFTVYKWLFTANTSRVSIPC